MTKPIVSVLMGSDSDWPVMRAAVEALEGLGVPSEHRVLSAHRVPEDLAAYVKEAPGRGVSIFICGAGMAAHLAGTVAAKTLLPVLGVPLEGSSLGGLDALLSTVQMPPGVPVATFGIGKAGAKNAGLFAAAILARSDAELAGRLDAHRSEQAEKVREKDRAIQ